MKKGLLGFLFLFASFAAAIGQSQKISDMPTFLGDPAGGYIPIVISGLNRKIDASQLKAGATTTVAGLRLSNAFAGLLYTSTDYGGGQWVADTSDHATLDNTALTLVAANGVRLKRINSGVLNALWWGLKGDGITDDYDAMQAMAAYINSTKGNAEVIIPKGTYYLNRYRTPTAGAPPAGDINFTDCKNLKIRGYGAVISVKGDFNRPWTSGTTFKVSSTNSIIPIKLTNCSNVSIEGLELNGNVDKMTRDAGVVEGPNHGVQINGCTDIMLKSMYIHHFATDGITTSTTGVNPRISCKRITFENVRSLYNARQGFTVGNLEHATAINCDFSYTGMSNGTYGGHSPQAGVDFEPNYGIPDVDVNAGEISFYNCHFVQNAGAQVTSNLSLSNVFFYGGLIDATGNTGTYTIICNMYNLVFDGTEIRTGTSAIYPAWGSGAGQKATFRNCRIFSGSQGFVSNLAPQYGLLIENCQIIGQHAGTLNGYFPYLQTGNTTFKNNFIFYDSAAYGNQNLSLVQYSNVDNNTWSTNLDTTGGKIINVSYSASNVTNEHYGSPGIIGYPNIPWIANDTSTKAQLKGGFNLQGMASRLANYPTSTYTGVPNAALNIQTKFGDFYYNGFTQNAIGGSSGVTISTPGSNVSAILTGGYQVAVTNNKYRPQETSMSGILQDAGRIFFLGKTGLTPLTSTPLDTMMRLDNTGMSLNYLAPVSGLDLKASIAARASMNVATGVRPTSPRNGDVWQDGAHTYMRIAGADAQLDNGAGGGAGTVSSVDLTMPGVIFNQTVSGSPVTSSGTLAPTLATQGSYTIFGNHTNATTTPTFGKLPVQSINATGSTYNGTKVLFDNGTWGTPSGSGSVYTAPWQTYTGTMTWGGTAPTGITAQYRWTQADAMVTVYIYWKATTAGSSVTSNYMPLPADCPAPGQPSNMYPNDVASFPGTGWMSTLATGLPTAGSVNSSVTLYKKTDNTFHIFTWMSAAIAANSGMATVTYWTGGVAP